MNKCGHSCRQNVCRCGWRFTYLLAVVLTAGAAIISHANAAQVNAIWNGGTGNWSDVAAWSGGVVPNNNATDSYVVLIDNGNDGVGSNVTLNQVATVDGITVDAGDTLTILNSFLTVANSGSVRNDGLFQVDATLSASELRLPASTTVTLEGSGALRLISGGGIGRIRQSSGLPSSTLHNGAAHAIEGTGLLRAGGSNDIRTIQNDGVIDANVPGSVLQFGSQSSNSSGVLVNSGVLRASNGGVLRLETNSQGISNAGGTVEALAGSEVVLSGATIYGGSLHVDSDAALTIRGARNRLDSSLALTNASGGRIIIAAPAEAQVTVIRLDGANTYTNDGAIELSDDFVTYSTSLEIAGNVILQGTGALRMSDLQQAIDLDFSVVEPAGQLTNAAGHTIEGSGRLGGDHIGLVNQGIVLANVAGGDLVIDPGGSGNVFQTNGSVAISGASRILLGANDTYQQTGGSTVVDGSLDTSGGSLKVLDGSLSGTGSIIGHVENGGVVQPGGSIGKLTISGDYTQNAEGALLVEIGGLSPGTEYDVLDISGTATLSGILSVGLANDFSPTLNDTFDILTAGSVMGEFAANALSLPALDPTLFWQIQYLPDVVRLSVVSMTAIPGDYDGDHDVDDADYLAWKGAFGSSVAPGSGADGNQNGIVDAADYVVWRDHYGQSSVANIVSNAVPEPEAWATMLAVVLLGLGKPISCRRCERGDEDGHEN